MIRIAFVIDTIATPGAGTEKQLLMLLLGLDRTRFEPTLVCLRSSEWLAEQSFPFDVRILNVGSILRPAILGGISRFRKLQQEKKFDIVQTFFIDANIFGTVAARAAGIRNVVSSRRNIGYWHTGLHKWILRAIRRWTPYYLANSLAAATMTESVEHVPRSRITVIYNGLDLERFAHVSDQERAAQRKSWGIAEDETLVGAVANLRPVKNIPALIHAASLLAPEFPRNRFVVVGEGPERDRLCELVRVAGLGDRFTFAGMLTDIVACLAAFDIAVLCSVSESFSSSLVEYMAAGLPIAASSVGGNLEAITHGETGLLFEPDGGDCLAAALREILSNPTRSREMGERARQIAWQRYDASICIRNHGDFYERIVTVEGNAL